MSQRLPGLVGVLVIVLVACASTQVPPPNQSASSSNTLPAHLPASPTAETSPPTPASQSPGGTPPDFALRTFTVWKEQHRVPVACDAIGIDNPVFGHLDGDPGNVREPVWLRAPDGTRLSIVWPEGFTAVLTGGELAVADETGAIAIRIGDSVELQVSRTSAKGTFKDPYYASGILIAGQFTPQDAAKGVTFHGCYPRKSG